MPRRPARRRLRASASSLSLIRKQPVSPVVKVLKFFSRKVPRMGTEGLAVRKAIKRMKRECRFQAGQSFTGSPPGLIRRTRARPAPGVAAMRTPLSEFIVAAGGAGSLGWSRHDDSQYTAASPLVLNEVDGYVTMPNNSNIDRSWVRAGTACTTMARRSSWAWLRTTCMWLR